MTTANLSKTKNSREHPQKNKTTHTAFSRETDYKKLYLSSNFFLRSVSKHEYSE